MSIFGFGGIAPKLYYRWRILALLAHSLVSENIKVGDQCTILRVSNAIKIRPLNLERKLISLHN